MHIEFQQYNRLLCMYNITVTLLPPATNPKEEDSVIRNFDKEW
jgi:hypothetical protein